MFTLVFEESASKPIIISVPSSRELYRVYPISLE